MELTGKIINILPLLTGAGKNGSWKKQEFILETNTQPPRKVCFSAWGDKIDQFNLSIGDDLVVSFDIESREYNGRWYTEVKAWKVTIQNQEKNDDSARKSEIGPVSGISSIETQEDGLPDDLPF